MDRRFIAAGLLGGLVALVGTALFQSLLPYRDVWGYKEVPAEELVLDILDRELTQTGLYLVPGHSPPDSLFRGRYEEGPIFRIHSLRNGAGGIPHVLVSILGLFLAPLIPAGLLWRLCQTGHPGFLERFGIVSLCGLFLAMAAHLQLWGTEFYPLNYSLLLALSGVVTWSMVGLVLAWRITPEAVSGPLDQTE